MLSCFFPCPQAWWSLNKPSGCAFGLAMTLPSLPGTEKPGMSCSPDFILIFMTSNGPNCAYLLVYLSAWDHLLQHHHSGNNNNTVLELNVVYGCLVQGHSVFMNNTNDITNTWADTWQPWGVGLSAWWLQMATESSFRGFGIWAHKTVQWHTS